MSIVIMFTLISSNLVFGKDNTNVYSDSESGITLNKTTNKYIVSSGEEFEVELNIDSPLKLASNKKNAIDEEFFTYGPENVWKKSDGGYSAKKESGKRAPYIKFQFLGTGFKWNGEISENTVVTIKVDNDKKTINTYWSEAIKGELFAKEDMEFKNHNVEITLYDGKLKSNYIEYYNYKSNYGDVIDYFDKSKFEYLDGSANINNEKVDPIKTKDGKLIWKNKELNDKNKIIYKLQVKEDVKFGEVTTNPLGKSGNVVIDNKKACFNDAIVKIVRISEDMPIKKEDILKTATPEASEDGKFTISLSANGEQTGTVVKDTDIILVLDNSGSMNEKFNINNQETTKLEEVKKASKEFVDYIFRTSNIQKDKIRIAVATFNWNSNTEQDFTGDKEEINNAIDSITAGGATNTQSAINKSYELFKGIKENRKNSSKFVVLFTDGLPTANNEENSNIHNNGTKKLDKYFKSAQNEYYKYFSPFDTSIKEIEIGGIGEDAKREIISLPKEYEYGNVDFYTIGVFTGDDADEKQMALDFLPTIQNVCSKEEYEKKYFQQDISSINTIFKNISSTISSNINNTIANNVVISDKVTDEFNIDVSSIVVKDNKGNILEFGKDYTYKIGEDNTIQVILTELKGTDKVNGIPQGGINVQFEITTNDKYFSGDKIDTNGKATISYNDPSTNSDYD